MIERGYIVAGSPTSVLEQMERLAKSLKIGHLVCLLHFGDMPNELCRYSTEMLATHVLPKLRGMWSEYEDRWSPRPMPLAARAVPRAIGASRAGAPRFAGELAATGGLS
jgi:hypothetical protein